MNSAFINSGTPQVDGICPQATDYMNDSANDLAGDADDIDLSMSLADFFSDVSPTSPSPLTPHLL